MAREFRLSVKLDDQTNQQLVDTLRALADRIETLGPAAKTGVILKEGLADVPNIGTVVPNTLGAWAIIGSK